MDSKALRRLGAAGTLCAPLILLGCSGNEPSAPAAITPATAAPRPALTVTVVSPKPATWEQSVEATGNIMAWQETIVGSEVGGLRIAEVRANVGDSVRKGQTLVVFDDAMVRADLAQARAQVAEARAVHAEARANADRARRFRPTGMMSEQQVTQYLTAEQTAETRTQLAAARLEQAELRLRQTHVVAPNDGLVSARTATVGTVPPPGQELFRVILGGRLEWRAEVAADVIGKIRPGNPARLTLVGGEAITGSVRSIAPSINPQTRNGIVYVDIPAGNAKAGMFGSGEIVLASQPSDYTLSLPQSAVHLRDGFAYVFKLGDDHRVTQIRVATGRRRGGLVEILAGLDMNTTVVENGVGFLADGDLVALSKGESTSDGDR